MPPAPCGPAPPFCTAAVLVSELAQLQKSLDQLRYRLSLGRPTKFSTLAVVGQKIRALRGAREMIKQMLYQRHTMLIKENAWLFLFAIPRIAKYLSFFRIGHSSILPCNERGFRVFFSSASRRRSPDARLATKCAG